MALSAQQKYIKVWSHRGSDGLKTKQSRPENCLYAFREAIREGADGLETDVHLTKDGYVILLHDPSLDRTTTGKGKAIDYTLSEVRELRSLKSPPQPVPTLTELVDMLMEPENQHIELNLDIKPTNDPHLLFFSIYKVLSAEQDWKRLLAPRIILGLWHPRFLEAAKKWLPFAKLTHLGGSPKIAREHFWKECSGFSLYYSALKTPEGQAFLRECKEAGKVVVCWTANEIREFQDCVVWDIDIVITDNTARFVEFRNNHLQGSSKGAQKTDSWIWSQYLTLWHSYEAAKDERWQHKMFTEVYALKHPPSNETTPELSPSWSSDAGNDLDALPALVLSEPAIDPST